MCQAKKNGSRVRGFAEPVSGGAARSVCAGRGAATPALACARPGMDLVPLALPTCTRATGGRCSNWSPARRLFGRGRARAAAPARCRIMKVGCRIPRGLRPCACLGGGGAGRVPSTRGQARGRSPRGRKMGLGLIQCCWCSNHYCSLTARARTFGLAHRVLLRGRGRSGGEAARRKGR